MSREQSLSLPPWFVWQIRGVFSFLCRVFLRGEEKSQSNGDVRIPPNFSYATPFVGYQRSLSAQRLSTKSNVTLPSENPDRCSLQSLICVTQRRTSQLVRLSFKFETSFAHKITLGLQCGSRFSLSRFDFVDNLPCMKL